MATTTTATCSMVIGEARVSIGDRRRIVRYENIVKAEGVCISRMRCDLRRIYRAVLLCLALDLLYQVDLFGYLVLFSSLSLLFFSCGWCFLSFVGRGKNTATITGLSLLSSRLVETEGQKRRTIGGYKGKCPVRPLVWEQF